MPPALGLGSVRTLRGILKPTFASSARPMMGACTATSTAASSGAPTYSRVGRSASSNPGPLRSRRRLPGARTTCVMLP